MLLFESQLKMNEKKNFWIISKSKINEIENNEKRANQNVF